MEKIIEQLKIDYAETEKVIEYYKKHKMKLVIQTHQTKLMGAISIREYIKQLFNQCGLTLEVR